MGPKQHAVLVTHTHTHTLAFPHICADEDARHTYAHTSMCPNPHESPLEAGRNSKVTLTATLLDFKIWKKKMSYWKWKMAPSAGWLQLWLIKLEKRARHTWGDSKICLTGAAVAAHLHRLRGGNGPEMRACGINYGPAMSSTWSIWSRTMIQQSQKEI